MSKHNSYDDVYAVIAGLERLNEDIVEIADDVKRLLATLKSNFTPLEGVGEKHLHDFRALSLQLCWYSREVMRMHTGLTQAGKETPYVQ